MLSVGRHMGLPVEMGTVPNPRVEAENHYYNAKYTKLLDLGLEPHLLTDDVLASLIQVSIDNRDRIDTRLFAPTVNWRNVANPVRPE